MKDFGMLHVYTGTGKGKTSAALGLAMRAVGHGAKVVMICFMKGDPTYGEAQAFRFLPGFTILQMAVRTENRCFDFGRNQSCHGQTTDRYP